MRADPLLRNAHLLTLSSLLNAGLGALYWLLATAWYRPAAVGEAYAAVAVMIFLAGLGQLNLADVLVRFLPTAGTRTPRLLRGAYLAGGLCTAAAAGLFLLLAPRLAPGLTFLREAPVAASFVLASVAYTWFDLLDGVLTGLRRPGWVVAENALFAVVKIAALAGFTVLAGAVAVFSSWTLALVVAVAATTLWTVRRAVPRHVAQAPGPPREEPVRGYVAADYAGSLAPAAAAAVVPLLVLNTLGAAANAYFSLAWVIAYTLYLVAVNIGSSLVVEVMHAPRELERLARRALRHGLAAVAAAAALTVLCAPQVLRIFGPGYAEEGTAALRLLALSALPHVVVRVAVAVGRTRRRMTLVVSVQAALCAVTLGTAAVLVPAWGVSGAGAAWLCGQCAVAAALLLHRGPWLPARGTP